MQLHAKAVTSALPATRARAVPTAVWLGAIVLASVGVRIAIAATVPAPVIFPDELVYWELGRSFAESGSFVLRDVYSAPLFNNGPLYPILIAPTFLIADLTAAYALVKALNAVLMSTAAVPAYFLACRVLSRRAALVTAAATVLVPSVVYTTRVVSENVSYPLFLCAVLAMTAALERPSGRRQLFALAAIGLVTLSRGQMAVLLPAFAGSIVLWAWLDSRAGGMSVRRHLRHFALTWAAVGLAAAAGLATTAASSLATQTAVFPQVRLWLAPAKTLWHIADLDLYSGVIPFAAFVLMMSSVVASRTTDLRMRIFASVSIATFAALVTLAGVYSTAYTKVYDRYVFYVVPLFFIALLAWIERGLRRPGRLAVAAAVIAALLPLTLPFGSLLNGRQWGTSTSTVGLVPWVWVSALTGEGWFLRLAVLAFAGSLALVFARTRPDRAWALARISGILLLLFGVLVTVSNGLLSYRAREIAGRNDLAWVDSATRGSTDVAILWRGDDTDRPDARRGPRFEQEVSRTLALREAEFFNRSIGPVYDLEDPLVPEVPSTPVTVRTGVVVNSDGTTIRTAWVLTDRSVIPVGEPVARDDGSGLVLYRLGGEIRLRGVAAR